LSPPSAGSSPFCVEFGRICWKAAKLLEHTDNVVE